MLSSLSRVGLALRANLVASGCIEVGAAPRAALAASRELRSRVGARLRLALLCKQGRGEATPLPSLRNLYSVLCTLVSTFPQAVGRFAPLHGIFPLSPVPFFTLHRVGARLRRVRSPTNIPVPASPLPPVSQVGLALRANLAASLPRVGSALRADLVATASAHGAQLYLGYSHPPSPNRYPHPPV